MLDADELDTILACANNDQTGRVTAYELRELVSGYRRALQAVGPEPAVAVKPLIWTEDRDDDGTEIHRARGGEVNLPYTIYEDGFIKKPFGLSLNQLRIGSFDTVEAAKAAAEADYASRIRSALVATPPRPCTCHPDDNPPTPCAEKYALGDCLATPPAEPVVEDIRKAVSTTMMRHIGPDGWTIGRGGCPRINWHQLCNELVAALSTKPAVKDDETVVEALRSEAGTAYCRFIDKMSAPLCLGVEHKLETGKFGAAELNAHVAARELYGFHRGINHALSALAAKDGRS